MPAKITDLTEALRASVEAVRKQKKGQEEEEEPARERPRARAKAS